MKNRICLLYIFNGFSDWEPSLAIAGLQQFTDIQVKTFSADGKPVRSMGNLMVTPDQSLNDIDSEKASLFILPGGNSWDEGLNKEVLPLVDHFIKNEIPLAAICGATSFLAQHGFLDNRPHTSNHLEYYLKAEVPAYRGEKFYLKEPCVVDGSLITANGTAIVQFAEAIFRKLEVIDEKELSFWFQFFRKPEMCLQ